MVNEHVKNRKLIALLAVVVICAMITGVAAWLSDDDTQTDEIVTGQVSIALMETNWRPENASDVHPLDVLPKNPTITNTGTSDAYVFIGVTMSALRVGARIADTEALMALQAPTPLYATRSGSGEYNAGSWQRLLGPLYDSEENQITWVYSYSRGNIMTPLTPGSTTSALFDSVQLANVIRYKDVQKLDANIYVHAYAIQTEQLGQSGNATSPDVVWSIVRNAYKVELSGETLPNATPKVIKVIPTPEPTKAPKAKRGKATATPKATASAKPKATATPEPEEDDEELYDDEALRILFGGDKGAKKKKSVG